MDKPPLHIWIATIGRILIGDNSFGYRFTSATSVFTTLVVVYLYTRGKYGTLAGLTAMLCLACNSIFIWRGRGANTDALLTLLILVIFIVSLRSFKWKYAVLGFLLSLVYLTKATVVLFPILSLGIIEITTLWPQRRHLKWSTIIPQWFSGVLTLVALPTLWLFLGYLKMGPAFIDFYLWHSDNQASAVTIGAINTLYLKTLISSLGLFALPTSLGIFLAAKMYRRPEVLSALSFSLPLLAALSFSPVHYHWYLMPAMPIFAILAGFAVYTIRKWNPSKLLTVIVVVGILAMSWYQLRRKIEPLFYDNAAYHQAQSGLWLHDHTASSDIVVRLDEVYPTVIFYSDRRVMVSAPNSATASYFISRSDLLQSILNGQYRWLNGPKDQVLEFARQLKPSSYTIHDITSDESVLEITKL